MSIEKVKQENDIIEIAQNLGIKVNKFNKACCPFHNDKTPSLQFSPEKQIATCFSGNCSVGTMDVISLVERKLELNTKDAIKYLVGNKEGGNINEVTTLNSSKGVFLDDDFEGMQRSLLSSVIAKKYLSERCLNINKTPLGIGYNAYKNSKFNYLKGCVTFALRDKGNKVVSMYGRSVQESKNNKHFYTSNRRGLYPCYPSKSVSTIILTESVIDACSLLTTSIQNEEVGILALYGTNGLTAEHIYAIQRVERLQEIILFLDGDKAGKEAVEKHGKYLQEIFINTVISKVVTPENEDINSLMVAHEKADELFSSLLENRSPLFVDSIEKPIIENIEISQAKGLLNTTNPHNIIYQTSTASYSIKGGVSKGWDSLKITLVVAFENKKSRLKVDLYEDKQVVKCSREIADKLDLNMAQVEQDLNGLTDELEKYREGRGVSQKGKEEEVFFISSAEKEQALKLLKSKNLIQNINKLIGKSGVVGEESARQALFIIASSYLIKKPLHGLIQGSSGSGKTHLMNKVLDLLPTPKVVRITRVTESSFYNYQENFFTGKVLGMEDLDGLEEKALFAFRELQSKGEITSSTTVKDEITGELSAGLRRVKGPIASLSCTTKGEVYEDNMSRSFLIAVNESGGQTEGILKYQQNKAAGLISESEEQKAANEIKNALSLLKPFKVINPFATKLQLPVQAQKIRRLHELFQYFVQTITVLNQHQRRRASAGNNTIITEKEDVKQAIEIMFDSIMLKVDELDGSLREFYEKLKVYMKSKEEESFSQREVRHEFLISKTQLQRYIDNLLELEYIELTGHRNIGYRYVIGYWDDIEKLRNTIKTYLNKQLEAL